MFDLLFEPTALLIFIFVSLLGSFLAVSRSSWFVDYLFLIVAFNRLVRRLVDYNNDYFNPYSLISLTPLVVCGFGTFTVVNSILRADNPNDRGLRKIIVPYGVAVGFAFIVGLVNSKTGAIYSLGEYLAPIGLIAFGSWFAHDVRICDRWCRSFCLIVFGVAAYGLWQFYTIPPWDAFWLLAVDLDGYMGEPEPMKMTLFTTMQERGPAGIFLGSGLILLLIKGVFPHVIRWSLALVIGYAMLLTYTRTAVILCIAAVILFPVINRGANIKILGATILFLAVIVPSIVTRLPGSEVAFERVSTLANIQDDGSFIGRIGFFRQSLGSALFEPLGLGLGAHGMAARVGASSVAGQADSTGYVQTLRTFGWIGTFLVVLCLIRLWNSSTTSLANHSGDSTVLFFRAWFAGGMVVFYSGDWLFTVTFFWVLSGYVVGLAGDSRASDGDEWNDSYLDYDDDPQPQTASAVMIYRCI
jgi:putative inorganic carbon (HCO3(-)) transporter